MSKHDIINDIADTLECIVRDVEVLQEITVYLADCGQCDDPTAALCRMKDLVIDVQKLSASVFTAANTLLP